MAEREVIPLSREIKDLDRQTATKTALDAKELSSTSANPLPIIVAEWPRNKREVIRVEIHEYQGRLIIGCRVWWSDGDGVLRPGKDGITLSLKHLPQLAEAFAKALATAADLGLPMDGGQR